jgi:hypothetical protein
LGKGGVAGRAILNEDVQTLLDGKRSIEYDETEAQWEDIVGISGLEEVANGTLFTVLVKIWMQLPKHDFRGSQCQVPS